MPIHLYAEHLLHIHTLSLRASLSSPSNKETHASLSADGKVLTLRHEREEASITLPITVSPNKESIASAVLPSVSQSQSSSKDITFRLQLDFEQRPGVANGPLSNAGVATEVEDVVPWTAGGGDLDDGVEISCRDCGAVLVPRGRVSAWKDLPSEGWAEMMEYWHCHKPVDHDADGGSAGLKKGYGASSRLAIEPGVGLVDAVEFLFTKEDCGNVEIASSSSSTSSPSPLLHCSICTTPLGTLDLSTQAYKLRKHHLSLSLSHSTASQPQRQTTFAPSQWLSVLILTAAESQGVRKFLVRSNSSSGGSTSPSLRIWLFTPLLIVSSSALPSPKPSRVAKVLWQEGPSSPPAAAAATAVEVGEKLNATSLAQGEIVLADPGEVELLRRELEEGGTWMPASARKFGAAGEWNVGLLRRFGGGGSDRG